MTQMMLGQALMVKFKLKYWLSKTIWDNVLFVGGKV